MGEYYKWINIDKKEYFCPSDFDSGSKYWESMNIRSLPIHALHSLLAEEWKGDRVIWFGDEFLIPENDPNDAIKTLYNYSIECGEYPGDAFAAICGSYKDVGCMFKETEESIRGDIEHYVDEYKKNGRLEYRDEYGLNYDDPFEGLFWKTARRYKYTINHTKRICYSLDETDIVFWDHTKNGYSDPLPVLMGYGRVAEPGEWLGDVIGVSDQRPAEYRLIKEIILEWHEGYAKVSEYEE